MPIQSISMDVDYDVELKSKDEAIDAIEASCEKVLA